MTWILDEMKREVFLVTGIHNCGMIVTWVAPAGLIPDQKRIMLALSPRNFTTNSILENHYFAIHLLSTENAKLVPVFGTNKSNEINKFENVNHEKKYLSEIDPEQEKREASAYLPILTETCGWCIGKMVSQMNTGDRIIVVADILLDEMSTSDKAPVPLRLQDLHQYLNENEMKRLDDRFSSDIDKDRALRNGSA